MKRFVFALCLLSSVTLMMGCSSSKQPDYDKKEAWAKTAPPKEWRGPGQPGGPPTGAMGGPMTPVPGTAPPPAAGTPSTGQ